MARNKTKPSRWYWSPWTYQKKKKGGKKKFVTPKKKGRGISKVDGESSQGGGYWKGLKSEEGLDSLVGKKARKIRRKKTK